MRCASRCVPHVYVNTRRDEGFSHLIFREHIADNFEFPNGMKVGFHLLPSYCGDNEQCGSWKSSQRLSVRVSIEALLLSKSLDNSKQQNLLCFKGSESTFYGMLGPGM